MTARQHGKSIPVSPAEHESVRSVAPFSRFCGRRAGWPERNDASLKSRPEWRKRKTSASERRLKMHLGVIPRQGWRLSRSPNSEFLGYCLDTRKRQHVTCDVTPALLVGGGRVLYIEVVYDLVLLVLAALLN